MLTEQALAELVDPSALDLEAELDQLARRYRGASGPVIELLNLLGGSAENLLDRLPEKVRVQLDSATEAALFAAMRAAHKSRDVVSDQPGWFHGALTTVMGAAGGMGGLPTALAELPLTTTVLLRDIQGVAVSHGFDPDAESVQFDCVQVFASAGPLAHDDGADMAFLATRMALRGASMQALIAKVAPRLAHVLGQKLAAQSVPVLGAVAGAATNYAYASYYRDMAHVHFRLRRLAIEADTRPEELVAELKRRVTGPVVAG
jgi:hypothetical protein